MAELQAGDTGQGLTRRRFIGAAASSVALLAVAPTACAFNSSDDGTLGTAVIGGGIFGATCAAELGEFCDVTLIERHDELLGEA